MTTAVRSCQISPVRTRDAFRLRMTILGTATGMLLDAVQVEDRRRMDPPYFLGRPPLRELLLCLFRRNVQSTERCPEPLQLFADR